MENRWKWGANATGGAARQHHDWERLADGEMMILANLPHKIAGFGDRVMLDDIVYAVAPDGSVTWQWVIGEHLGEFAFTPAELALVKGSREPDYFHVNTMAVLGPNHWADAGDQRFAPTMS